MKTKKYIVPLMLAVITVIFTICLKLVDVGAIGPNGSVVGFSALNKAVNGFFGESQLISKFTDILLILSFGFIAYFGYVGVMQLIKGKSLKKVDKEIIAMGVVYIILCVLYVLFENVIINYRPMILPGETELEAAFPSSHTMLFTAVLGSTAVYLKHIGKKSKLVFGALMLAVCAMAFGRIASGEHWFTDVVGGLLYGMTVVAFYKGYLLAIKNSK